MDKRTSSHEGKHAGAFKRLTSTLKNPEPTVRRTMCDGRSIEAEAEENISSNVRRVGASVGRVVVSARWKEMATSHVLRLCCLNNCGSFAVGVGGGAREHVRQERSDIVRCL